MNIRRAMIFDLSGVERVYNEIHDAEVYVAVISLRSHYGQK